MRCASYCTSNSYKLDELTKFLRQQGLEPKLYDQVIHVEKNTDTGDYKKHIFYYPYGCVVFWGFNEVEESLVLKDLIGFEADSLQAPVVDIANYFYSELEDEKTHINEENDDIILVSDDRLIKLSLSCGLSQSVKLSVFETSVNKTINKTKYLPEELKNNGKSSLSRKKLTQLIGGLFAERNSVNLHCDILDTPEFFWRRPKYETYYIMAAEYMDISTRLEILNRRLAVIHELYQILSTELNHIHSNRLEIIIVVLIMMEVLMGVYVHFYAH